MVGVVVAVGRVSGVVGVVGAEAVADRGVVRLEALWYGRRLEVDEAVKVAL